MDQWYTFDTLTAIFEIHLKGNYGFTVGYRVAECTCDDTSVCDGARFVEGRPESCIAYNKGGHGSPIQVKS